MLMFGTFLDRADADGQSLPHPQAVRGFRTKYSLDSLLGLFANPRTRGGEMCKYSRLYIRKNPPSERTRV